MKISEAPMQSLDLDEALKQISNRIDPVGETENTTLADASGRVLAQSVLSPIAVPRDDNSAMDGYALRSEDLPSEGTRTFVRIGTSLAGKPWDGSVGPSECIRIMTGAVVPDGADTVVIQEDVTVSDDKPDRIQVDAGHRSGDNIRYAGEELQPGDELLETGRKLTAIDIGLLASVGVESVSVYRRVRVGVLSTGDELREPGQGLPPGCIYNSNLHLLSAALKEAGAIVSVYGNVADEPAAIRLAIERGASENDLLLTSGGVSVGDVDFVQEVLNELGEITFWKVRIKPGKPLLFGSVGSCKVIGLPGNPVSAAVTFALIARPVERALAGEQPEPVIRVRARLTERLSKRPGRRDFQRGILREMEDGSLQVTTTGPQGSHRLTSLTQANCLIDLPADSGSLEAGSEVLCVPIHSLL